MHDSPPIPAALAHEPDPVVAELLEDALEALAELDPAARSLVLVQDAVLADAGEATTPIAEAARWQIEDDRTAEWAMRRLASAQSAVEDTKLLAAEWIGRVQAWADQRCRGAEATAAFFEHHLADFALRRRDADPKAKSVVLPSGVVRTVSHAERVVVAEEGPFLAWAYVSLPRGIDYDQVVKVTRKPIVSGIRDRVRIVGDAVLYEDEIVPGLAVAPASVTATVVVS